MSVAIAAVLATLAVLDGSFAAFRSSVGRTGLVNHRADDLLAARRGAILILLLLLPIAGFVTLDISLRSERLHDYTRVGLGMIAVYLPYALLVLAALLAYAILGWRFRYLASAVILGPFTLARPLVAVAGWVAGAIWSRDVLAGVAAGLCVVAVLAVEPLADRRWYDHSAANQSAA